VRDPLKLKKRRQLFVSVHNEALTVAAMCVCNSEVRPLESIAETQPQLHPALGIVDHLRCSFARFKLCVHLLDLGRLLVQTRRHSFHSFLLLRDLPAEIGSCDLPEAE